MINKQEEEENEMKKKLENSRNIKISQEKEKIEIATKQIQNEICSSFERLIHLLKVREKQLLRQVDVLHHQQIAFLHTIPKEQTVRNNFSIEFDLKDEEPISEFLSSFGKINLNGSIFCNKDYSIPALHYIEEEDNNMTKDHICFSKPLQSQTCQSESVINFKPLNNKVINLNIEIKPKNITNGIIDTEYHQDTLIHSESKNENLIDEEHTGHLREWLDHIKSETEIEPPVEPEFESSLSTLTI